jgi:hypothetical protein
MAGVRATRQNFFINLEIQTDPSDYPSPTVHGSGHFGFHSQGAAVQPFDVDFGRTPGGAFRTWPTVLKMLCLNNLAEFHLSRLMLSTAAEGLFFPV